MKRFCVLSLSGGMDSSTLLLHCLDRYDHVTAISFDYGQKHKHELNQAQRLITYLSNRGFDGKGKGFEEKITYKVIKLEGLGDLLNSTLVEGGKEVPEGYYNESNQRETVVPNRNKIFVSIIQAIALSISNKYNTNCDISLGIHSGDHTNYPDTTPKFRDLDEKAFREGNWDSDKVRYYTPYINYDKVFILEDGLRLCEKYKLDFNEFYKRTFTSYKPIIIKKPYPMVPGNTKIYSDYKSGSSIERILAFNNIRYEDPLEYADENGPVSWEIALKHALETEKTFKYGQLLMGNF